MTDVSSAALERIRALLAKAENTGVTREESDTYMGKAMELMAKYGVDKALVDAANNAAGTGIVSDRVITIEAPYVKAKSSFLKSVAAVMRVRTVRKHTTQRQNVQVHMFGMESDLERVEMLFTSLLVQCAWFQAEDERSWAPGVSTKALRNAYLYGFAERVCERLQDAENQAVADAEPPTPGMSTDLVLADRNALVDQRVNEVYPKLRRGRRVYVDTFGMLAGNAAGDRADIGGARVSAGGDTRTIET